MRWGIASAFVVLLVVVGSVRAEPTRPRPGVAVLDCWLPEVKPDIVLLACGDGTQSFDVARWTRWSRRGARAVGTASVNDCDPSCVDGHVHTYRALLLFDRARMCGGRLLFTRMRLVFAKRPGGGQPMASFVMCKR